MHTLQTLLAPVARFLIALIFFVSGINKIFSYAGTQGYMEAFNISGGLLPVVIIIEIFAGLAVIIGWKTKLAASTLAGFSVISALIFHANFADQIQFIFFMKNIGLAGGLLLLVANGPGAYALDNRFKSE
ncbi:MAG: DoxX family protein [Methylococcales bacterium]